MKLLQRKQFPGPPPPQQAAGLVLLIVQVAPLPPPPPHEMMDQFSHFTRAQHRDNTLIMLLLVNTRTRPASQPPQVQGTGDTGADTQCRDCNAEGHLQLQLCGYCDGGHEIRGDCLGRTQGSLGGWLVAAASCVVKCSILDLIGPPATTSCQLLHPAVTGLVSTESDIHDASSSHMDFRKIKYSNV